MYSTNRRQFLTGAGALALSSSIAAPAIAQAKPRLVVVGGGPGGATIAKYVARDAKGAIDVTLVEPSKSFVTCFHSNLYLGGFRPLESITHSYSTLASKYGVKHAATMAAGIDREKKTVRLADGSVLAYDRLAIAPGIEIKYESVPGYSQAVEEQMPHAWKAGPQTVLLKKQLDSLSDGSTIVMIAPPNPYRCPPGPYERVSMMAHVLKAKGHKNSKIIVIDPKATFSKQGLFVEGWEKHYPGMVEWQEPKMHGGVKSVDAKTMTVVTDLASYKANLINVIPAQSAGKIALDAKLANDSGFCPINPENMQSAMDANIYIVGDSCIPGDMPKSGFSANSQAKVAAMMIRGDLAKSPTFPARYTNTCWSLIATDDNVKVGGSYEPKDGKIFASNTFVSKTGEPPELRKQTAEENIGWYAGVTADIFG